MSEKRSEPPTASDTVALIDDLLGRAVEVGASDIHFEPTAGELVVKYRLDGVLNEVERLPKANTDYTWQRIENELAKPAIWRAWQLRGGYPLPLRQQRAATAAIWQDAWNSREQNLDRIFRVCVASMNEVRNAEPTNRPTPPRPPEYQTFLRIAEAMAELEDDPPEEPKLPMPAAPYPMPP